MAHFYVGTSGWHYHHWRGVFCPAGRPSRRGASPPAPPAERKESPGGRRRRTVPDGFRFAVKASRFLTHIRRLAGPEEPLERVLSGARLLGGRLGPPPPQLPPG